MSQMPKQFISVSSQEEALAQLDAHGEELQILAGGTDLMVQLQQSGQRAQRLLHIENIPGLRNITCNGVTGIGALCTHRQIAESTSLDNYRSLRQAAAQVGGWQTQMVGTIGGNVVNASPAADTLPPLLIHNARVTLVSQSGGSRAVELERFLLGRRQTDRRHDELVSGITLARRPERGRDCYIKVGRRSATEVAIVGLAACVTPGRDGRTLEDVRLAVCSVCPMPKRLYEVEHLMQGEEISEALLEEAGEIMLKYIDPIDDVRASKRYRLMVAPRVLKHAIACCMENVSGDLRPWN